jgi:hypothetical protein
VPPLSPTMLKPGALRWLGPGRGFVSIFSSIPSQPSLPVVASSLLLEWELLLISSVRLLLAALSSSSLSHLCTSACFDFETNSITSAGNCLCSLFRDARSRASISSMSSGIVSYHAFPIGGLLTHSLWSGSHK